VSSAVFSDCRTSRCSQRYQLGDCKQNSYDSNRPHVLTQVNLDGGGSVSFDHDQNGNVTQGHGETITYNAFNKPLTITGGGNSSSFSYGANLMRYRQETPSGSIIYYIDKLMEIETLGSTVDYRHYLGDVAIVTKTGSLNDPSPSVDYLFRDRLGGVSMIGDVYAAVIEHRGYDAYGKPRNGNWTNKTPATIGSNITDRGFTDHEHLDDWQLIHMNGRGYDYNLGRFLSVDPFIQDPGNSQAINGYSYIGNNPLSGTDPTGYSPRPMSTGTRTGRTGSFSYQGSFETVAQPGRDDDKENNGWSNRSQYWDSKHLPANGGGNDATNIEAPAAVAGSTGSESDISTGFDSGIQECLGPSPCGPWVGDSEGRSEQSSKRIRYASDAEEAIAVALRLISKYYETVNSDNALLSGKLDSDYGGGPLGMYVFEGQAPFGSSLLEFTNYHFSPQSKGALAAEGRPWKKSWVFSGDDVGGHQRGAIALVIRYPNVSQEFFDSDVLPFYQQLSQDIRAPIIMRVSINNMKPITFQLSPAGIQGFPISADPEY
tara:strand:- start:28965 stop:30593 length:1629 start_codon:yes stop_codon:yes gene_type:complete